MLTCLRRPQGRGLELARKHIASCISELECALSSSEFLRSVSSGTCDNGIEDKTTASGYEPVGFDASLNCRLSAPTPPRAIKILSWKKVRNRITYNLKVNLLHFHNAFDGFCRLLNILLNFFMIWTLYVHTH